MKNRVLFVDDEEYVLKGLSRGLRSMRHDWELTFAHGPHEALKHLDEQEYDVIVTDMLMPEINGVEVLNHVKTKYPDATRVVLSGEMGTDLGKQAQELAHHCLTKPRSPSEIKELLERVCPISSE